MASGAAAGFLHNAAGALWTTQSKAIGEATAVTVGGAGAGLWSWNRAYYPFDAHLRWARFSMINNMAIAQTGQYREDIEDLAQATSNRMDNYHILGVMALTVATALFCPGRLGLHTPPPPSWLMGLFMVNLAAGYLWLAMTMWMAMHASLRADSAACHMLTRMVRMPVPSQKQLDRARMLFSNWEGENFGECFRVPFFQKHSKKGDRAPGDEPPKDDEASNRVRCELDVPAWFRRERNVDEGRPIESFMPRSARAAAGATPEHFEVFRVVQNEYWPYDIYARLSMFLAWMHLLPAWGYFNMGHVITETRAIWAGVCVCVPLFVAMHVLITLDLTSPPSDIFPWHRLGPFGLLTAYVGQVLEYTRWYSDSWLYLSSAFVFITYFIEIIYTAQLLRLCSPDWDKMAPVHESPAAAWWPTHWRIPTAWAHSTWMVAPPKERAQGECDLVDELRRSSAGRRGERTGSAVDMPHADVGVGDKKDDVHHALGKNNESPAWFFVRTGLIAILIAWVWLTFGYFIDIINEGTTHPSLISAPGLPNHLRDPRWRQPKPGYVCTFYAPDANGEETVCIGQEVGTGGYYAGPGVEQVHFEVEGDEGEHRRLKSSDADQKKSRKNLGEKIRDLLPYLQHLIRDREDSNHHPFGQKLVPVVESAPAVLAPSRANVEWPALFEPRLLACGPNSDNGAGHVAAALSRQGRGALITSKDDSTATAPFVLEGTALFGPFLAAHWDHAGLVLTTSTGGLVECPGSAVAGRWRCQPLAAEQLPLGLGAEPFAGALAVARRPNLAEQSSPELLSAVVFPGELSVAIFRRAAGRENAPWLPAGEARTPSSVTATAFDENAESLLMLLADGAVARMRISDGAVALVADAVQGPSHTWQATCGLANSKVARLGVRPSGPASWEPSLIFGA